MEGWLLSGGPRCGGHALLLCPEAGHGGDQQYLLSLSHEKAAGRLGLPGARGLPFRLEGFPEDNALQASQRRRRGDGIPGQDRAHPRREARGAARSAPPELSPRRRAAGRFSEPAAGRNPGRPGGPQPILAGCRYLCAPGKAWRRPGGKPDRRRAGPGNRADRTLGVPAPPQDFLQSRRACRLVPTDRQDGLGRGVRLFQARADRPRPGRETHRGGSQPEQIIERSDRVRCGTGFSLPFSHGRAHGPRF